MRLIDADDLITMEYGGIKFVPKEFIDDAPTIEERKKGKWIEHHEINMIVGSIGGVTCSVCGWQTHNKLHLIVGCPYDFCPKCGARMAKGEEDE